MLTVVSKTFLHCLPALTFQSKYILHAILHDREHRYVKTYPAAVMLLFLVNLSGSAAHQYAIIQSIKVRGFVYKTRFYF